MKQRLEACLLVIAVLTSAAPARAHSLLLESSPAPEGVVAPSPARFALRFNNRIEKALSRVRVITDRGKRRELTLVPTDGPDRLMAEVPPLAPGRYQVEWQVLSVDGHVVTGRFSFRVAP